MRERRLFCCWTLRGWIYRQTPRSSTIRWLFIEALIHTSAAPSWLIKSIIILHTFPPGAGLMIVAMFIKEHWLELNLSVDCLKIFLDELHRWGCEYSCNVTDWMCFHLYLHTNTFSPWQSILFFTLIPFLSSAGSPSFLFWCILFVTFVYFCNTAV